MRLVSVCIFLSSFSFVANAVVDTKSAGYSKTFVDFKSFSRSGFPMKIERAYNSRSLYNGLFGFGWCSNMETKLDVLPDNSIRTVECGAGMEIIYHPVKQAPNVSLQVDMIMKNIRKKRVRARESEIKKLRKDLMSSQTLRSDFLKALNIKGKVVEGVRYYGHGRLNEYVVSRNGKFYRKLPNDIFEVYNQEGRLVRVYDRRGNVMNLAWGSKDIWVRDNRGRRLQLLLNPKTGKIKEIKFQARSIARYKHNGREDLIFAQNSHKEKFGYKYDNLHNLTEIVYPDKTKENLTYNTDKDWVMSFKNRKGCKEVYGYGKNPKNPKHYYSTVKKTCGRKIVNKSKYEFWNRDLPNGKGVYLYRARSKVNGRLTDVIYHHKFGTPYFSFTKWSSYSKIVLC